MSNNFPPAAFADSFRSLGVELDSMMMKAMALAIDEGCQVFEFGKIDEVDFSYDMAFDLWHHRQLRLPFKTTLFRFRLENTRVYMFAVDPAAHGMEVASQTGKLFDNPALMVLCTQQNDSAFVPHFATVFDMDEDSIKIACEPFVENPEGKTKEDLQNYVAALSKICVGLCLLLNTKGLRKREEPVPHRLNKKRGRQGKYPLTAVTYIDVERYLQACHATTGHGTPKSMHLRRGHIRHYADGATVWVRDTIVKADGELKKRERYEVKRHET